MTTKEMATADLAKALQVCHNSKEHRCSECPVFSKWITNFKCRAGDCKRILDFHAADRLMELEAELERHREAEREGRLVILPCKVGDTVVTKRGTGELVCWDHTARVKLRDEHNFEKRYIDFAITSKVFNCAETALAEKGERT